MSLASFSRLGLLLVASLFVSSLAGHANPLLSISELNPSEKLLDAQNDCPEIWSYQEERTQYNSVLRVNSSGQFRQWQVSSDQGANWTNLSNDSNYSGVTTASLRFENVIQSMKDNLYRLKISNSSCSIFSKEFHFKLPLITEHPEDQCVEPWEFAEFQTSVLGSGLIYQWQTRAHENSHWYNIYDTGYFLGTKTNKLRVEGNIYWLDGYQFRLYVSVPDGFHIASEGAELRIGAENCPSNQVNKWTGAQDRRWNNTANWSLRVLPDLESEALIPGGLDRYPMVQEGANAQAKNLIMESGAFVEVRDNWLQLSGNIDSQGTIKATEGSIAFMGTEAQAVPSSVFQNNQIADFLLDNPAGATLEEKLDISRSLKIENGTFHTGGHLRLLSDEVQTALIDGSGNGSVQGTVTMQRYLKSAFGYKYMSTPFKNTKVGDFATHIDLDADFPNFYYYKEDRKDASGKDASGWEKYTNRGNALRPMQGYALNFGNASSAVTVELQGELNQGTHSLSLENNSGTFTQGFHLIGNPYPSPIDWDARGWTKDNIDAAIYFFTASEDSQYTGTYRSYASGVSTDGSSNTASSIIPSMQGFFVRVSDSPKSEKSKGMLAMTDEVRVNNFSQQFYRSSVSRESRRPLLRISASFKGEVADPTVVYFDQSATESYDSAVDALKMMNTDVKVPNLYSFTPDGKKLSINALPSSFTEEVRLPLGISAEMSGSMTMGLQDIENFPGGLHVYLIDLEKRMAIDLNKESNYSFHLQQGVHNGRFELLLTENRLEDEAIAFKDPFSVKSLKGNLQVKLNLESGQKGRISITSLSGQVLGSREGSGKESVDFDISDTGIYIVSLELGKDRYAKKVLIGK